MEPGSVCAAGDCKGTSHRHDACAAEQKYPEGRGHAAALVQALEVERLHCCKGPRCIGCVIGAVGKALQTGCQHLQDEQSRVVKYI